METEREIQEIKSVTPLIRNLHPSWNCPEHIGWQILRLNRSYRQYVLKFHPVIVMGSITIPGISRFTPPDPRAHAIFRDFFPIPQESFQDYETRVTRYVEEMVAHQVGLWRGFKFDKNALIPHTIRFPHPWIRPLLPLHKLSALTIRRGHPQDWLLNLLIFELSQAGIKNAEIGRLLFGMKKSRPSASEPKSPILVRINKTLKQTEKIVSESYHIAGLP